MPAGSVQPAQALPARPPQPGLTGAVAGKLPSFARKISPRAWIGIGIGAAGVLLVGMLMVVVAAGWLWGRMVANREQAAARSAVGTAPPAGRASARVEERPIPQDLKRRDERARDRLAYQRQNLVVAYDKVGKKDPRWDKPAREALEAAARVFSYDPVATFGDIFDPAQRAIAAGCDDPLVLYVYARAIGNPPEEKERRYKAAAVALERSAYPPPRRIAGLHNAVHGMLGRKDLPAQERQEAKRMLDAALAILPQAAQTYGQSTVGDEHWLNQCMGLLEQQRQLTGDHEAAFKRVDAELAKAPALRPLRLLVRGRFHILFAWEARGSGYADTVTPDGWQKMRARLGEARRALEEAWKLKPGDREAATLMLSVELGSGGGDRRVMEMWFERALKADPDNLEACRVKMDWLDPKWHGSVEELLAFGRACAATRNWQSGITLQAVDAHNRVASRMTDEKDRRRYFRQAKVRAEIQAVCEEYLKHRSGAAGVRGFYAGFCYQGGRYAEANRQFKALGNDRAGNGYFTAEQMRQMRDSVAKNPPDEPAE